MLWLHCRWLDQQLITAVRQSPWPSVYYDTALLENESGSVHSAILDEWK